MKMGIVEFASLAREFGTGAGKLLGGHAMHPLPAIVSRCSSAFHDLADYRQIILQSANRGVQRAGKVAVDGHALRHMAWSGGFMTS
jgi:hypothetical protein